MIRDVRISKQAEKSLRKLPRHVIVALAAWMEAVELRGLDEVRKIPGYHDEPLHGARSGQRSIRLNRSWRAFYVIVRERVVFVEVIEINHHEY